MATDKTERSGDTDNDLYGLNPKRGESTKEFAHRVLDVERKARFPDIEAGVDQLVQIWEEADPDEVISLRRVTPVTMVRPATGETVSIRGYLEDVPPGCTLAYVQKKYGGGLYFVQRRSGNKFLGLKRVEISGPPRCPEEAGATEPVATVAPVGGGAVIDGVPIDGTNAQWEDSLQRLMATKKLLSDEGSQINETLLKMLMESRGPSVENLIGQMGAIVSGVRDLLPQGDGGGTGLMDLGGKLLDTVKHLADKRSPAPRPGQIAETQALALPEAVSGQAETSNEKEPNTMPEKPDVKTVAGVAIANLIAAFQLDPPKEPARVVVMLDNVLGLDKETRVGLLKYSDLLFDMAETQLSDYFSELPDKRAEFKTYYDQVFASFVDPEREVVTL